LPIDPVDIGRSYEAVIRVNSQSGKGGVAYILENDHQIRLPKAAQPAFSKVVQQVTDETSKEITPEAIWELFEREYLVQDGAFELISFSSQSASLSNELERITAVVRHNDDDHMIKATGNGPIAAFVSGMRETFGLSFKLIDYEEHTRAIGSNAQAAAYINLRYPDDEGRDVWGVGIDTSITLAPIKAVVSAINRFSD
jgi:2-isopropylmalate synthase